MLTERKHLTTALLGALLVVGTLAGCGQSQPMMLESASLAAAQFDALHHHSSSNSQPSNGSKKLNLVTIECTVVKLLPADNSGLPHQVFNVKDSEGTMLEVDNDTHYGSFVPGLKVGEQLTIRGVEYHDTNKDGIHWTHHDNVEGDAGFIQTPDGRKYQ
ncbi:MAG TPA: DUF3465 domain-containing protein [Oscillatoriaceae cyanobacterium]